MNRSRRPMPALSLMIALATQAVATLNVVGCQNAKTSSSPQAPAQPGPSADASSASEVKTQTAIERARSILESQLEAAGTDYHPQATYDTRNELFHATFSSDAVVMSEGGAFEVGRLDSTSFNSISVSTLVAGGDADLIWLSATFHDDSPESRNPGSPVGNPPLRYTAVATKSTGWKVVAAVVVDSGRAETSRAATISKFSFPNKTNTSDLTQLALDGQALAASTTPQTTVISLGAKEPAAGPSALGRWANRKLTIDPDDREIISSRWGIVQSDALFSDGADHGALGVLLVARRDSMSKWAPDLVQYIGH